jgi:hypothetical protein
VFPLVTYPMMLFGLAFALLMLALLVVYDARRARVKVVFLGIAGLCLLAMVGFGVWQVLGPWPPVVWQPW